MPASSLNSLPPEQHPPICLSPGQLPRAAVNAAFLENLLQLGFGEGYRPLSSETGSYVAQADLDHATQPRITMHS